MSLRSLSTLVALALLSGSPTAAQPQPQPGTPAYDVWVGQQLSRLREVADRDAIRSLAFHYARGNDELSAHFADHAKGRERAAAEYAQAFARDVQITVYPLRSTTPLRQVTGIPDWIAFADGFFENAKYSSSLHLMSNFDVKFSDPDTARVSAYAGVPHFIQSAAKDAGSAAVNLEYMLARYDYVAKRQPDGGWRATTFTIHLDEIARIAGFYPNGQAPGR